MNERKNIIIPLGFNAKQRKESLMSQLPSSFAYEWMETSDFVQQYLYCMEDGPYDPPLEVWILYWPSPSEMVRKMHPTLKRGYSSADMALAGIKSEIPVDECIDAMKEVGDAMASTLKETAGGGLATTPTGIKLKEKVFS